MKQNFFMIKNRRFFKLRRGLAVLVLGMGISALMGASGGRSGCIGYSFSEGCKEGESRACFSGPADKKEVGACKSGQQKCSTNQVWGPCEGEILPKEKDACNGIDENCDGIAASVQQKEVCNGADDNCDGKIDEGDTLCPSGQVCRGTLGCKGEISGSSILKKGSFQSSAHPTQGEGQIIQEGDKLWVEFSEGFKTDQGPDLKVYLTTDALGDANKGSFLSLGPLTSVNGKQRYALALPAGQSIDTYNAISVWCEAFRVIFGYAPLLKP